MNNLALFVTHNIFLTKDQIDHLLGGNNQQAIGHCVPVWVDAKTGLTTEPASEIFCTYEITNSKEHIHDLELLPRKGYEIFLPHADAWVPPQWDLEKMALMSSEERQKVMAEQDRWWFSNPKPPSVENLKNGYLRFEIKKNKNKINRKQYSEQHIIEISHWDRLNKSLTV